MSGKLLKFKNYGVKPNGFGRFDVYKEVERKRKIGGGEEKYIAKKEIAYAITFESAIKRIITSLLEDKHRVGEIETLKGYIESYRELLTELETLIKLD